MKDVLIKIDGFGRPLWMSENTVELLPKIDRSESVVNLFEDSRELLAFSRWIFSKKLKERVFRLSIKGHKSFGKIEVVPIHIEEESFIALRPINDSDNLENYWNQFTKTFPGGLLFLDSEYNIKELTQATLEILQIRDKNNISYSKASILGKPILELLDENLKRIFLDRKDTREGEYFYFNKSYLRFVFQDLSKEKKRVGFSVFIFDYTNLVKRNTIIEQQKQSLVHSSRLAALGEMAGGVAHEINNPLAVILLRCCQLEQLKSTNKLDDQTFDKFFHQMKSGVDRISKIVQSLKIIARDPQRDPFEKTKISEILQTLEDLVFERFRQNQVQLTVLPENLDVEIECRPVQISQVLVNILNNSFDAISDLKEKWVHIEVRETEKCIELRVEDSGNGISSEIIQKIFEPFYTTKTAGKGTGLGLSLSKSIMADHAGNLYLDKKSQNTCFVLSFPKIKEECLV